MQFSAKTSELSKVYNIDPKDVLFALLISAGASTPEAFASIFRPTVVTNAAIQRKAAELIGQKPGLKRLMSDLDFKKKNTPPGVNHEKEKDQKKERVNADLIDYTNKDAMLRELAEIAGRAEKESDRLAAIREIIGVQKMKSEAKIEEEKRVVFYIPLTFRRCEELTDLLTRFFKEVDKSRILPE